jgi:hypothetical protein
LPDISYYLAKIPENAPPAVRKQMEQDSRRKADEDVFGAGFQRDKNGRPIERGIGSPGNENETHFLAILKHEGAAAEQAARAKAAKSK